ncbi:hypothetical protein VP01_4032g1 [Puccinia sorghi]|uniref:Uncharacterized protein n=1 Tax=Puccinia sorghi TaxID=27349 RepID=A0A0L6URS1_9BASI|nr:hypothetical protein VP01_4032g1 [Puccinia sorghi]
MTLRGCTRPKTKATCTHCLHFGSGDGKCSGSNGCDFMTYVYNYVELKHKKLIKKIGCRTIKISNYNKIIIIGINILLHIYTPGASPSAVADVNLRPPAPLATGQQHILAENHQLAVELPTNYHQINHHAKLLSGPALVENGTCAAAANPPSTFWTLTGNCRLEMYCVSLQSKAHKNIHTHYKKKYRCRRISCLSISSIIALPLKSGDHSVLRPCQLATIKRQAAIVVTRNNQLLFLAKITKYDKNSWSLTTTIIIGTDKCYNLAQMCEIHLDSKYKSVKASLTTLETCSTFHESPTCFYGPNKILRDPWKRPKIFHEAQPGLDKATYCNHTHGVTSHNIPTHLTSFRSLSQRPQNSLKREPLSPSWRFPQLIPALSFPSTCQQLYQPVSTPPTIHSIPWPFCVRIIPAGIIIYHKSCPFILLYYSLGT